MVDLTHYFTVIETAIKWSPCRPSHHIQCLLPRARHPELSLWEGSHQPTVPGGTRPTEVPQRRGALHRMQVVRGSVSGTGHHYRGGDPGWR